MRPVPWSSAALLFALFVSPSIATPSRARGPVLKTAAPLPASDGTGARNQAQADPATADASSPSPVAPVVNGPWGDVNADGLVTEADAAMVMDYLANLPSFTPAQIDRIERYGDVAGVVNRTTIGNNTVNSQDTMRMLRLAGGNLDAGTAGPAPTGYGDVNGDGKTDIVDAVLVQRSILGRTPSDAISQAIHTRGVGDISPTVPYITFGDGVIDGSDATVIRNRALGTESNPPAYTDFWPMHAPDVDHPTTPRDLYTFTDLSGRTGDLAGQVFYQTQSPVEVRGYTATQVLGTDGSMVGVFKGQDGSIYALFLKYPAAFGDRLVEFSDPLKVLDARAVRGELSTWSGASVTEQSDLGAHPVIYKGTLLGIEGVETPAAGSYTGPTDAPRSTWSQTARIRLDVGILAGPADPMEMQQAFFFDLMPFIGIVQRGQASLMGSPALDPTRPHLRLDEVKTRGITYNEMTP